MLGLIVIHFDHILGVAVGKGGKGVSDFLPLHERANKGIGGGAQFIQGSVVLILEHEFKPGHVTKSLDGRESKEEGVRVLYLHSHFHRHRSGNCVDVFDGAPFIIGFHPHKTRPVRRGIGVRNEVQSFYIISLIGQGFCFKDAVDFFHGLVGLSQRASGRCVDSIEQETLVFRRNKARRRSFHHDVSNRCNEDQAADGDPSLAE